MSRQLSHTITTNIAPHCSESLELISNAGDELRAVMAELLNVADPGAIRLTTGATESLSLAINALGLEGGHVVTTVTEHESVLKPLQWLEEQCDTRLSFVGCDRFGYVDPDEIRDAIASDTRAVVMSHCSNVTGVVQDLDAIAQICHERDVLLVVDGAQSVGLQAIDLSQTRVDLLAFSGHKYLLGPEGVGGLYVNESVSLQRPIIDNNHYRNHHAQLQLIASVRSLLGLGLDEVQRSVHSRVREIRAVVEHNADSVFYSPEQAACCTFNLGDCDPVDIGNAIERSCNIVTQAGSHCAVLIYPHINCGPRGCIRITPLVTTSDDDMAAFKSVIEGLLVC